MKFWESFFNLVRVRNWNRLYFAVLLSPVIVALLVPALRIPVLRVTVGGQFHEPDLSNGFQFDWEAQFANLSDNQPHALEKQAWALRQGFIPPKYQKRLKGSHSREYSQMLAQAQMSDENPRSVYLVISPLILGNKRDGRVAGPWEDNFRWDGKYMASIAPSTAPLSPPPPSLRPIFNQLVYSSYPNNLVSAVPDSGFAAGEAELGLRLARRGQALEPANTFFDWTVARNLFVLHRDTEALRNLLRAAHKPTYNLHINEFWRASFLAAGSPSLAEEKWAAVRYQGVFQDMLHVQNMALWTAMQREDEGIDRDATIKAAAALARLRMLQMRSENDLSYRLMDLTSLEQVWISPRIIAAARILNRPARFVRKKPNYAAIFASIAKSRGHSDIARETLKFSSESNAIIVRDRKFMNIDPMVYAFGGNIERLQIWWLGLTFWLWLFLIALGLWIGFSIFGPLRSPRGTEPLNWENRITFYPLTVGCAISFCLLAVAGFYYVNAQVTGQYSDMDLALFFGSIAISAPFVLPALTCLVATTIVLWKERQPRTLRLFASEYSRKEYQEMTAPRRTWHKLEHASNVLFFRVVPFGTVLCIQFLILIAIGFKVPGGGDPLLYEFFKGFSDADIMGGGLLFCLGTYLLFAFLRWRFLLPPHQRPIVFAGFLALRRALAWTMPVALWVMLLCLIFSTKPRAELDRAIMTSITLPQNL